MGKEFSITPQSVPRVETKFRRIVTPLIWERAEDFSVFDKYSNRWIDWSRAQLVEFLAGLAPDGFKKIFLLTAGSEATECAIKLSRARGIKVGGRKKIGIIGFERGFHGRTLGSQQTGGAPVQKSWIVNEDPAIVNAPFPDAIEQRGLKPENIVAKTKVNSVESSSVARKPLSVSSGVSA
ncbi:MAG: aminotransferase class III-fold pyridoxal phosphate-dependent enzyme [Limisphaerales bacterium]